jgi:hypothetical protein
MNKVRCYNWLLWAGLIGGLGGGCAPSQRYGLEGQKWIVPVKSPQNVDEGLLRQARQKPGQLFVQGLQNYAAQIKDYRCTMIRQERLGGSLTAEQQIEVAFLDEPYSVFFKWVKNPQKADRLLYVKGKNEGKMLVAPVLVGWLTGAVLVDPVGKEARESGRRPVTEFGFKQMLERLAKPYETGKLSDGGGFEDKFVGMVTVGGREALLIERLRRGETPKAKDVTAGWRICLDSRDLMPLAITEFSADQNMLGNYVFTDIRYNTGLKAKDFEPAAVGMKKGK